VAHIPQNNGRWSGRPGDSVWFPDMASVPTGANDPYRPRTFRALILGHALWPVTLRGVSAFKRGDRYYTVNGNWGPSRDHSAHLDGAYVSQS